MKGLMQGLMGRLGRVLMRGLMYRQEKGEESGDVSESHEER